MSGEASTSHVTVGVDVGGTSTRIVVFDAVGGELLAERSPTPHGAEQLVNHLATSIGRCAQATGAALAGVGIGIPGGVSNGVVSMALNIGVEQPLSLSRLLAEQLRVPVTVENDVNAAAYGAFVHHGSRTAESLAYLSIGTGFAAGLVIDGQVVRGAFGAAGEIGHIPVPSGGSTLCVCGQRGCVEAVASGRALIERMRGAGLDGRAEQLWDAADAGAESARAIRDDALHALAWCCQAVILLLDVQSIVIGGGVALKLEQRLLLPLRSALDQASGASALLKAARLADRIEIAPAGVELGALGADRLARLAHAGPVA